MASITRKGFGQVEPNHLSAQRTGQIYAQLPAAPSLKILENGRFLKYDYQKREANLTGDGEWLLVYNEIKLYDPRKQGYRDFAQKSEDAVDGVIVPRLFKTNVGDIFTTNTFGANTSDNKTTEGVTVEEGNKVVPSKTTGYLEVLGATATADGRPVFKVVAITEMPDGQIAAKLQRVE